MKKRIVSMLLALALCLGLLPGAVFAADEHTSHPICGATCADGGNHQDVDWIGVTELTNSMAAGNYYLKDNVTITATWKPKDGTTLCLNGHYIYAKVWGAAIQVNSYVTFTLTDCTEMETKAGYIVHSSDYENNDAYFKYSGSGVCVKGGNFVMYGGKISGNGKGTRRPESSYNADKVYNVDGGGVYVDSGKFIMNGGTISGNNLGLDYEIQQYPAVNYRHGGGVYVDSNAEFIMNNGTISKNTVTGYNEANGGGVYVAVGGKFTMNGGSISGNKALGSNMLNGYASGSAVYIAQNSTSTSGGSFTMNGGAITNNLSKSNVAGNGAVYCEPGGSLLLDGMIEISGNTFSYTATVGTPYMLNANVYLGRSYYNSTEKTAILKTGNQLRTDESIGITFRTSDSPRKSKPHTISDTSAGKYENCFKCDDDNYTLGARDGALAVWYRDRNVTFTSSNDAYGKVSATAAPIDFGGYIVVSDNQLKDDAGNVIVTATPEVSTEQFTYKFTGWTQKNSAGDIPYKLENGTYSVIYDLIFTANFTCTENRNTVTFNMNGHGDAIEAQSVLYGEKATQPNDPEADGYTFDGWYTDNSYTNKFDFNKAITEGGDSICQMVEDFRPSPDH